MKKLSKWCLLGIPDHQGVLNVSGRLGAAGGPEAFRKAFKRFKGRHPLSSVCQDLGDVGPLSSDIHANHKAAIQSIRSRIPAGALSVIVGGGHDHGYSQLAGLARPGSRLGCINIDAHLDVRKPSPVPSSGSPFYLALEAKVLDPSRLIEFGIQDQCNAPELWDYVKSKKISVIPIGKLRNGKAASVFRKELLRLAKRCDQIVISLDLDAVAECSAPGVSAPQAEGLSPSDLMEMMEHAGAHPKVRSLGIFELNPEHDLNGMTARLAATAAYRWLASTLGRSS